jgi:molybdenum cofactor cytidylyltransferase
VVTGAIDAEQELGQRDGVTYVHNPNYASGQATSLAVALEVASATGADAIVVGLGDQPWVSADQWHAVAARLAVSERPIVLPTIDGEPAQPVGLQAEVWPLLPAHGDAGARALIRNSPELVDQLPLSTDPRSRGDVDTPEDL